ncbi:MAG TPA: phage integrase SAM-like domain-containing protein [Pirellulales bacterium]|nr:phage integrase SAM-like domain-containing protein [Pirellulales bacterium]
MTERIDPSTIKLADRVRPYVAARSLNKGEADQYRYALNKLEKFLGRPATLADLNAPTLNEWLLSLQEGGLAPKTVKNNRGRILALWNDALDEGVIDNEPRRLRKVKIPRWIPTCWSPEEVARLLAVAQKVPGRFLKSRVVKSAFWEAFVLFEWDTALRLGDVRMVETATVRGQSTFRIVQSKTDDIVVCQLRPETLAAIEATFPPKRKRVFGSALSHQRTLKGFGQIIEAAGLSRETGTTRMLRKSSATAVEALHPGAAMRHLGHRTPGLAYKHYVDPRFISEAKPIAPALPGMAATADDEVYDCLFDDGQEGGPSA